MFSCAPLRFMPSTRHLSPRSLHNTDFHCLEASLGRWPMQKIKRPYKKTSLNSGGYDDAGFYICWTCVMSCSSVELISLQKAIELRVFPQVAENGSVTNSLDLVKSNLTCQFTVSYFSCACCNRDSICYSFRPMNLLCCCGCVRK